MTPVINQKHMAVFIAILFLLLPNAALTAPQKDQKKSEKPLKTYKANIRFLENKRYVKELLRKINRAKKSIDIGMYLFKTTKNPRNPSNLLLKALVQAKKERNIKITVLLERSGYNKILNAENQKIGKYLKKKKIRVCWDKLDKQTHTKLIIIDQKWTFIGSHNFSHSALKYNNEASVLIESRGFGKKSAAYLKRLRKENCPRMR